MEDPTLDISVSADNVWTARYRKFINPFTNLAWLENHSLLFWDPNREAAIRGQQIAEEMVNYLTNNPQIISQLKPQFQYIMLNTSILEQSRKIVNLGSGVTNPKLTDYYRVPELIYINYDKCGFTGYELVYLLYGLAHNVQPIYWDIEGKTGNKFIVIDQPISEREYFIVAGKNRNLMVLMKDYISGMPQPQSLKTFLSPAAVESIHPGLSRTLTKSQPYHNFLFGVYVSNLYSLYSSSDEIRLQRFLVLITYLYLHFRSDPNNWWFIDILEYLPSPRYDQIRARVIAFRERLQNLGIE